MGQERFGGAKIVTAGCYAHSAVVSEDGGLFTRGAANLFGAGVVGHDDRHDKLAPSWRRATACSAPASAAASRSSPPSRSPSPWVPTAGSAPGAQDRHGVRRKLRQVAGTEPAGENGKGKAVMALAGEPGLVKMVLVLCGDWTRGVSRGGGDAAGCVGDGGG